MVKQKEIDIKFWRGIKEKEQEIEKGGDGKAERDENRNGKRKKKESQRTRKDKKEKDKGDKLDKGEYVKKKKKLTNEKFRFSILRGKESDMLRVSEFLFVDERRF